MKKDADKTNFGEKIFFYICLCVCVCGHNNIVHSEAAGFACARTGQENKKACSKNSKDS